MVAMRMVSILLAVLGAVIMLASGVMKLIDADARDEMNSLYEAGGSEFGIWFFVLVGIFEVAIAALLLIPRTRVLGGFDLFVVMVGAFIFNLFLVNDVLPDDVTNPRTFVPVNVVIALLGVAIMYLTRRQRKERRAAPEVTSEPAVTEPVVEPAS